MVRLNGGAEADEHTCIDGVGLGEDAGGPGEVADLAGVDAEGGEVAVGQVAENGVLVAAGGLEQDALVAAPGEGPRELAVPFGLVDEAHNGLLEPEGDVQRGLGDVDADDGRWIGHVVARSCEAGVR